MNMKFMKGLFVGGLITTGVVMMCTDNSWNMSQVSKKSKKLAKKMGLI